METTVVDDEDSVKSFLKHMRGRDHGSLVSYANLIYSGMAQIPVPKGRVVEFKAALLRWVSKCGTCGQPVGSVVNDCRACEELLEDVVVRAQANYALYKDHGFCCMELEGLDYRNRPWKDGEGDAA